MAGPIQKAMSEAVSTASAITAIGKKLYDNEGQIGEKKNSKSKKKVAKDIPQKEGVVIEDKYTQELASDGYAHSSAYMADDLAKLSLADSLLSRKLNRGGFTLRLANLKNKNNKGGEK